MSMDAPSSVSIQTSAEPIPSMPEWFGEVALLAHTMTRLGLLAEISERVRFSRKRFGTFEVIDFVVVLMGYAISGEPTRASYYQRLQPFAAPFMALFGRERLPHRSTLSRFLAALDQASVEALRSVFAARTRWLVRDPWRVWEVCGIGKGNDGWSSIWTARDRLHDSVRCPRVLISLRHSDACKRSVHLATRDASAERWFALGRRSCRLIPISGWERLGMRAMRTTEGKGSRGLEVITAYQAKLSLPRGQALIRLDGKSRKWSHRRRSAGGRDPLADAWQRLRTP